MKIENFINRIKINRQYAKSTVYQYTRTLNRLDKYIKNISLGKRCLEDTNKLTVYDIEQFIYLEKLHGKTAKTCDWYLATIRDFVAYAERYWEKVFNYKQIVLMKEPKRKIDALSENEMQKLLNYMKYDKSKDELTKTRDYAIVSVLFYTWLRVSELCNIKTEDVKESLQIIGKNNTLRLVYLFQEHITLLRLYMFMREWRHINSEYFFCSHANNTRWKQLSRNSVETMVKKAWVKAWISTPIWPHKLRHTFATSLLRRWGNIYYIKELLGHQHITTTQTYLSATNNDLKKTQNLLRAVKLEEQSSYEEELSPMPENIIIKDRNLYEKMKSAYPFWDSGVSRGVPAYWYSY